MALVFNKEKRSSPSTSSASRPSKLVRPGSSTTWDDEWEDAPKEYIPSGGQIIDIWGETGTGKSTLAFTSKAPIAYFCFTEKAEGIIEAFAATKKMKWRRVNGVFVGESEEIKIAATAERVRFERLYYNSLGVAATTILDTHPEAWGLERLSEFGSPKPERAKADRESSYWGAAWGAVNDRWRSMVNAAKSQSHTNVIFIGGLEDEYGGEGEKKGKKTGRRLRIGTSAAQLIFTKSSISLQTKKVVKKARGFGGLGLGAKKGSAPSTSVVFSAEIVKGWSKASEMEGKEIEGEKDENGEELMLTIPNLLALCSGTEKEEWE